MKEKTIGVVARDRRQYNDYIKLLDEGVKCIMIDEKSYLGIRFDELHYLNGYQLNGYNIDYLGLEIRSNKIIKITKY